MGEKFKNFNSFKYSPNTVATNELHRKNISIVKLKFVGSNPTSPADVVVLNKGGHVPRLAMLLCKQYE